jgi:hypothetical protein
MKNGQYPLTRMSPCLRIFIESLLAGFDVSLFADELFVSGEGIAMSAGMSSTVTLASDKNYN